MDQETQVAFIKHPDQISDYDTYNGNSLSIGFSFPKKVFCYCDFQLPYDGPFHYLKELILVKGKKYSLPCVKQCYYTNNIKVRYISRRKMYEEEIKELQVLLEGSYERIRKINVLAQVPKSR